MKVLSLEISRLKVPLNKPMRTRYITNTHAYCLLLQIKTDNSLVGQGLVHATSLENINIMAEFIQLIYASELINKEFISPEQTWQALWLNRRNLLQSGLGLYALSAIDIALWDIKAQQENMSLSKLLNIQTQSVQIMGNGGWLSNSHQEMATEITWYLERGCNHFKIRVGCDNDISRIKFLRETFGNQLKLAADANQYYDFDTALEMSKILADYDFLWFEEPLFSNSISELTKLAALSPIPIATGENMNSHWQIQDICQLTAAQIIQPDVIYQGGITEFKRSAEIIKAANLTLGAHLFHELSASLAGLCEKNYLEHIDFFPDDFFIHNFEIINGKVILPETYGHGVTVSNQAIDKYVINSNYIKDL